MEAKKRPKRACDEGGFLLWARIAIREAEVEARVKRVKRQREMDGKGG